LPSGFAAQKMSARLVVLTQTTSRAYHQSLRAERPVTNPPHTTEPQPVLNVWEARRFIASLHTLPPWSRFDLPRPGERAPLRSPPPGGLLTPAEAARKLRISLKTLAGHVASGALRYVRMGHGRKRRRMMFTAAEIDSFIANQTRKATPCPSTAGRARRTGISTSIGEVIDFTGPRKPPTSAKRRK